jgi:spore coat polysaccharide biosynthesis protein SpsF
MTSTRLPGKVLMPLAGRPILDWVFRAAQSSAEIDDVILATSHDPSDDVLAEFAVAKGVKVVRGPLDDVLGRFVMAVNRVPADAIVRLTADCPLLDPALIDSVVSVWRHNSQTDYVASTLQRSLPRGLDVECVRASALLALDRVASGYDRTHVTSMLYAEGSKFSRLGLTTMPNRSHFRLTVDAPLDFEALHEITLRTGDRVVPWREILEILETNPNIAAINNSVRQKDVAEG